MFHLWLPTLYPVAVCRRYLSPSGGRRGGGEQMGAGGGVIGVARLTERVRVVVGRRRDTDNTAIRLRETDPWISAAWYKRPRRRRRRRQVGQQGDWLSAPGWRKLICLSCRSSWGSYRKTCLTALRTQSVCYLETKRKSLPGAHWSVHVGQKQKSFWAIYVWLLLERGAGRSYVGSSSFHFSSGTRLRSSIQAPLAPPHHRRRHHNVCIFPATFLLPVSPLQPLQERLEAASWIAAKKGARQTFWKKKKLQKALGNVSAGLQDRPATASRHRCTLAFFLMEKEKNQKTIKTCEQSPWLKNPLSFGLTSSLEH